MKKALVLFLALAMLLPMAFLQPAKADAAKDPFYMLTWEKVTEGKYDNVYNAPLFWTAASVEYKISWSGASSISDLATKTYELFKDRPVGTRFINFGFPPRIFMSDHVENHVYMDQGVEMVWTWFNQFLAAFASLGGDLDGIILDTEISKMNAKNLQSLKIYREIVEDSRYKTEIRPLLVERGFPFYEAPTQETPEISSIHLNLTGDRYDQARAIWDQVMQYRVAEYLDECVCELLWDYFPNAWVSDFQSADRDGWYKFPSTSGQLTNLGVNTVKVGNTSNYNAYHTRPGSGLYKDADGNYVYNTPFTYNGAIYEESAFNMTLWDINLFKNIYASTDNKTISAWVRSYNAGNKPLAYSAYATEVIYHLGMLNPQPFLGHVIESNATDVPYYERLDILSQQLHELNRVAGYADRKVIEVPANWNDSYLLSGMYANGKNIWRITPDTAKVSLEAFKTNAKDPTFCVGGKTITFPGGKIIEDTQIDAVGSCGYWVETAANVTPVVTADKNRYEKYPALLLDFDDCQAGAFDKAAGKGAWELTGSTNIAAVNGSNALTLTGDATANCITLPGNITAGDAYAKNQTWEATVTIPETDGTLQLLHYAGENQAKTDGGFKVEGGKVYYSKDGAYVELGKVTPGTYVFRRTMDFNDPAAFTACYYLLNDKGAVLAKAENIPAPAFTAITSIGFATKKATKALALDNFRIAITGSRAADFTLYNVATGLQVADPKGAQSQSTAYRLSWLNASDKVETAKVQVALYENGQLKDHVTVKTIQMEPGCDGVETGIVEVADGQTVKIKLVTSYMPPEPEEPDATEPTTAPTKPVATKPAATIIKPIMLPTKVTISAATTAPTTATQATEAPTQVTDVTETTAATEATQATGAPEATQAPEDTEAPNTTAATTPASPKEDPGTTNVGLIIAIVVLALAGAGAAIYILFIKKKA